MAAELKYDMTVHPTAGLVRSASRGNVAHQVTLTSCDCEDYINRKGCLVTVDGVAAVTVCKHIAEFMERVGGWNRKAPEPAHRHYPGLSRSQAFTVLTSSFIASNTADRILNAAFAADGLVVSYRLTSGRELRVGTSPASPALYSLWVPAEQPVSLPEGFPLS